MKSLSKPDTRSGAKILTEVILILSGGFVLAAMFVLSLVPPLAYKFSYACERIDTWSNSMENQLLVGSVAVAALFIGGIYWLAKKAFE